MEEILLKEEETYEIVHYKKYHYLKNVIDGKNPNMIIHGVSGSGKTYLIEYIFKKLYGNYKTLKEDKFSFKTNKLYYIFDFSHHLKNLLMKKIESIVKTYDHYNDTIKYIIIDNYNNVSDIIQKNIKVFIEKYYDNSRFILLTNKLFSIDQSVRNSCFNIKINYPTKNDKYIYFKNILDNCNIKYNPILLSKNCEKHTVGHIYKIYYHEDVQYDNIYYKIDSKINEIMHIEFDVNKIKKISMEIKELNLDISRIFSFFVLKNPYSEYKNRLLIKEISHYNYIIKRAYRDIISIEALLVKIYCILNYE